MPPRRAPNRPPAEQKVFSPAEIDRGIARLEKRVAELRALDPATVAFNDPRVAAAASNIRSSILEVFGQNSTEQSEHGYHRISYGPENLRMSSAQLQQNFARGLPRSIALVENLIVRLREKRAEMPETEARTDDDLEDADAPIDVVRFLCSRFHLVARQLLSRHHGRATIKITDEYDVQDLLRALLRLSFDDIREEEWTPSYAGSASRVDFLLKLERIVVEVKKTRSGLSARELGEQLIVDIARYQAHPDCQALLCFVYDPDGLVKNPRGLEGDLSRSAGGFEVQVLIAP